MKPARKPKHPKRQYFVDFTDYCYPTINPYDNRPYPQPEDQPLTFAQARAEIVAHFQGQIRALQDSKSYYASLKEEIKS
jgi:hypothetical protein